MQGFSCVCFKFLLPVWMEENNIYLASVSKCQAPLLVRCLHISHFIPSSPPSLSKVGNTVPIWQMWKPSLREAEQPAQRTISGGSKIHTQAFLTPKFMFFLGHLSKSEIIISPAMTAASWAIINFGGLKSCFKATARTWLVKAYTLCVVKYCLLGMVPRWWSSR